MSASLATPAICYEILFRRIRSLYEFYLFDLTEPLADHSQPWPSKKEIDYNGIVVVKPNNIPSLAHKFAFFVCPDGLFPVLGPTVENMEGGSQRAFDGLKEWLKLEFVEEEADHPDPGRAAFQYWKITNPEFSLENLAPA